MSNALYLIITAILAVILTGTMLIWMVNPGKEQRKIDQNNVTGANVSETIRMEEYYGMDNNDAVSNSGPYYDGCVIGSQVIEEILSSTQEQTVFLNGINLSSATYNNIPSITYYQTVSAAPLLQNVDQSAQYTRYYSVDSTGKTKQIFFRKVV